MKGEYGKAIRDADTALQTGTPSSDDRARANLIKAQSQEKLGDTAAATGLYEYIVATFPESSEAYQARQRLKHLVRTGGRAP